MGHTYNVKVTGTVKEKIGDEEVDMIKSCIVTVTIPSVYSHDKDVDIDNVAYIAHDGNRPDYNVIKYNGDFCYPVFDENDNPVNYLEIEDILKKMFSNEPERKFPLADRIKHLRKYIKPLFFYNGSSELYMNMGPEAVPYYTIGIDFTEKEVSLQVDVYRHSFLGCNGFSLAERDEAVKEISDIASTIFVDDEVKINKKPYIQGFVKFEKPAKLKYERSEWL